jgi:2-methylcitrate dehydratase PrpD
LSIYGEALTYCGNREPVTPIQAQFSLSYGLASALVRGDLGPEAYDANALRDSEVRRLEALVSLVEDPVLTRNNKRAATLTVTTKKSRETITASQVPGDPDFPLTTAWVEAKFLRYSTPIIGADRAAEIASAVLNEPLSTPLNGIV